MWVFLGTERVKYCLAWSVLHSFIWQYSKLFMMHVIISLNQLCVLWLSNKYYSGPYFIAWTAKFKSLFWSQFETEERCKAVFFHTVLEYGCLMLKPNGFED